MFKRLLTSVGFGELPSSFGFTVGDTVELPYASLWELRKGQRRSDGQPVSIFVCSKKDLEITQVTAAKNAEQMSKSLRHPNILFSLDSVETDGGIYIATDEVEPLLGVTSEEFEDDSREACVWGLYQALDALSFLHSSGFTHGLFGPAAIFVTRHGDYKLGALDLCRKDADPGSMLGGRRRLGVSIPRWPEPPAALGASGAPAAAIDLWGAALLTAYVFSSAQSGHRGVTLSLDLNSAAQAVPSDMRKSYLDLQKVAPLRGRSPIAELLNSTCFQENDSVRIMLFLSSLHIKSSEEKDAFFDALPGYIEHIPREMQTKQVLKELLSAQKFPGQEAAQVLPAILKIGVRLKDEDFKEKIQPLVVQLFGSPDRAVRFRLLSSIGEMINNLDDGMINEKIFPECVNGFTDSSGPIREATVKSLVFFVPRLKTKVVEGRVVKLLLKTLTDPEASIRTNSVICCGRISSQLSPEVANQMLGQALTIGVKDPFGPCRAASLRTLLATMTLFSADDLATKLLPIVCQRLVDPDPSVGDVAFEAVASVQKHLRQLVDEQRAAQAMVQDGQGGSSATAAVAAANAASSNSWGAWAFSTVGSVMGQTLAGSMMSNSPGPAGSSAALSASTSPSPTSPGRTVEATSQPEPPPQIADGQRHRATSGMTLTAKSSSASQAKQAPKSDFGMGDDDLATAGGSWADTGEDFWDDFGDISSLPRSSLGESPEKPAANQAAKPPAQPAARKVVASAKPKAVPLPAKLEEDDDFWKEFNVD